MCTILVLLILAGGAYVYARMNGIRIPFIDKRDDQAD